MNASLWDAERLQVVGSVLTRYSAHLRPGHRIRLGMEGDTSGMYRASDERVGTVKEVFREPLSGLVRFQAVMDDGDEVSLDNRNVDAVWEIHPEHMNEFQASVSEDAAVDRDHRGGGDDDPPSGEDHGHECDGEDHSPAEEGDRRDEFAIFRAAMDTELSNVQGQMQSMMEQSRVFQETIASTVRHIAADLLHAARGAPLMFAEDYADRYDLAIAKSHAELKAAYRGVTDRGAHQTEKYQFSGSESIASVQYELPSNYKGDGSLQSGEEALTDDDDDV